MIIITPKWEFEKKPKTKKFFEKANRFIETIYWSLLMIGIGWILGRMTEAMARGAF